MRGATFVLSAALLAASCGRDPSVEPRSTEVSVQRAGWGVSKDRVGVAALLSVGTARDVGPIELELRLVDHAGQEVGRTDESLPHCAAGKRCWWAASFSRDQFGPRASTIERVEVAVKAVHRFDGSALVQEFAVSRSGGVIRGTAPGSEGIAYVIAFADDDPRWGIALNVAPRTGGRAIGVTPDLMPSLAPSERLGGYFYPGPVSPGD